MRRTRNGVRGGGESRRGIALLLVMIGLVVCTILTAGFLSTQGTAIGIAKNERDAERARGMAQSGVDMGIWLIKNRADWRTTMQPGLWLKSQAIGGGMVSLWAKDGTGSFSDDPTAEVTLTSMGSYNGRTFTLTARVAPTGGGTVFRSGNFVGTTVVLGKDITSTAVIDSYDSGNGNYNSLFPGSNAAFASNLSNTTVLTINGLSIYRGSLTVGPNSILGLATVLSALGLGPSSTSAATETRAPGNVMLPNPATPLTSKGALSKVGGTVAATGGSSYTAITLSSSATMNITSSGIVRVTGNMVVNSFCTVNVQDGVEASIVVDGNLTNSGTIKVTGGGTLKIYARGSVTMSGTTAKLSSSTTQPRKVLLLGTSTCTTIRLTNGAEASAAIYAPQAEVRMDGTGVPKIFGAVVANSLRMDSNAALHFDENLRSLEIQTIYGGSAPAGVAYYTISTSNGGALSGAAPSF